MMMAWDRTKIKADSKELDIVSSLHYCVMSQSMGRWRQRGHQIGQAKNFIPHAPWSPLQNMDLQNRTTAIFSTKWYFYFYTIFMILLLDN